MSSTRKALQSRRPRVETSVHSETRFVAPLLKWFLRAARDLPWRQTLDPYGVWISEIMLQQTQVKTVIPYWERWMRELPDVSALARASQDRVLKLWEGLGYYSRARNLQKAARQIGELHEGRFPRSFEDVLALPGIGRYTAGAICSIAYNDPAPILDGNVIRVLTRLFALGGDPREKKSNERLWQLAESAVRAAASCRRPQAGAVRFALSGACSALNQALMELGALICTPQQPRCSDCPLQSHCQAWALRSVDQYPNLPPRVRTTERRFVAFVIEDRGRWLVRQRPAGMVNAHLWEFPAYEVDGNDGAPARLFAREFQMEPASLVPLPVIRHSITRYRMTLAPFRAHGVERSMRPFRDSGLSWRTSTEIEALALTSAHRKLWKKVQRAAPGNR